VAAFLQPQLALTLAKQNWPKATTTTTQKKQVCWRCWRDLNIFLATHNCMHIKREEQKREKNTNKRKKNTIKTTKKNHKGLAHEIF